jgi:uncharacterized membrane protein YraQ (UPF0718 family)
MFRAPKRAVLALTSIAALAFSFGYFSRYPDLNRKAVLAEKATVSDTLSMFPILPVRLTDPLWKQVAFTTVNWAHDNRRGMAFGIAMGALFLALFRYVSLRPLRSAWANSALGMLLGTPLGVCVNCAAPVFKGALESRRIELAIAMMLSSPTLNVVVLTMTFSLFPLYMAVGKLVFNLSMILLLVPLLAARLKDVPIHDFRGLPKAQVDLEAAVAPPLVETLATAAAGFGKDFARSLGHIFIRTAPLMLVAGLLGSIISHAVRLDRLQNETGPLTVALTTAVGLLLPVPMAFDVVLTNALFSAGLPNTLAFALLLSLGSYSLYSMLITWRSAAWQWALSIFCSFFAVIASLSLFTPLLHRWLYLEPNLSAYRALAPPAPTPTAGEGEPTAIAAAPALSFEPLDSGVLGLSLSRLELTGTASDGKLHPIEGPDLGLDRGFVYSIRDYPDPFWIGRGTAAGDFDDDGWPDLAFGSDEGPLLYKNVGGRFVRVPLEQPWLREQRVYAVAFVDLDNDSRLDLFVTTFNQGNYVLLNQGGTFRGAQLLKVPNLNGVLTVSPAFADLDLDGDLDVVNGNMAMGVASGFRAYGEGRQSSISWNHALKFTESALSGPDGEAMASLVSDIDNDGLPDLYLSQDFVVPDRLFFSRPAGLTRLSGAALSDFEMPYFSMSADTGDFDNDLSLDLLVTGTLRAGQNVTETLAATPAIELKQQKNSPEYCQRIHDPFYRANCLTNRTAQATVPFHLGKSLRVDACKKLEDPVPRDQCLLAVMWTIITENAADLDCPRYAFDARLEEVCRLMKRTGPVYGADAFSSQGRQVDSALLYRAQSDHGLQKVEKARFDHPGGWTWSSKFGDLDSDGWLDIVNAEGAVAKSELGFNVLMHNEAGQRFVQQQFAWGFTNDFNLYSLVLVDLDRDGDLDVVGNGSEGPIQVYRNRLGEGRNIAFQLRLKGENRFGVGAKVIIHTARGSQLRELKASGGYLSFDAPELHFGVGDLDHIDGLTLITPKGRRVELPLRLATQAVYRLELDP